MNLEPPRLVQIHTGPGADPVVFTRWVLHLADAAFRPASGDVEPHTRSRPPAALVGCPLFFFLLFWRADEDQHQRRMRRRERDRRRRTWMSS